MFILIDNAQYNAKVQERSMPAKIVYFYLHADLVFPLCSLYRGKELEPMQGSGTKHFMFGFPNSFILFFL